MNRLCFLVALMLVSHCYADPRAIALSGGNPSANATFEIGVAPIGSSAASVLLAANLQVTDSLLTVRDKLMPVTGMAGIGKRAGSGTYPAIRVFHPDTAPFWWRVDGGSWNLLEPATWTVTGLNFSITEGATNGPVAFGDVPAVSAWGLILLALMTLGAGSVLMRRPRRA